MVTGKVAGVIGTAAGVAGIVATALAVQAPEEPDFNEAKKFLVWYYETAPSEPQATWPHLTESFRSRTEESQDFDEYRRYFAGYRSIVISDVNASTQAAGWWSARLDFTRADGTLERPAPYFQFDLRCPDRTKWPFIACESEDLEINATNYLD